MKRLVKTANSVSPFIHRVVNDKIVFNPTPSVDNAMLIAKQALADLPIVPTGERVYELAQEIRHGLLDNIGGPDHAHDSKETWESCIDIVERHLIEIGALVSLGHIN